MVGKVKRLCNGLRLMVTQWMLEVIQWVTPKPEKYLLVQANYMVCKAMLEGRETLPTIYWGKSKKPTEIPLDPPPESV